MKYIKYELETTTESTELVTAMLLDIGVDGVEVQDKVPLSDEDKAKMYIDILPEMPEDDKKATVVFYSGVDEDKEQLISRIKEELEMLSYFTEIGSGEITYEEVDEENWRDNWKQYFKSFRACEGIVIKPTWEETCEKTDEDIVIEIDPQTAFGTGAHETTKLCITSLRKRLISDEFKGASVLDFGCGSGILSIVSKKLGAGTVTGVDIDPIAVDISYENADINHTPGINFLCKNVLDESATLEDIGDEEEGYDILVANILADVIIPLSKKADTFLKKGGIFISSGIINTKEEAVRQAILDAGLEIISTDRLNEWVSFTARKR